ncbi:MAG: hypothetical protein IKW39_00990 [Alphaproteobacteria bacterium]|nr:hypothetical protein [Alphaproteobacteria bacterium]
MRQSGNIFLYNTSDTNAKNYHQELKKRGYYVFDTNNLYKLSLYNKEITPDVLLFDFDRHSLISFITSIENNFYRKDVPVIIVSEAPKALIFHPAVSHYLTHLEAKTELLNILHAYTFGNTAHHILYINLKPYETSLFIQSAKQKNYKIFEVNNINSASAYLKKNKPKVICINFLPALTKSQKLFAHPKTFYVDNKQNVEEIEQFLN